MQAQHPRALRKRTAVLEDALDSKSRFEGMIGQSAQMRAVYRLVETVSPSRIYNTTSQRTTFLPSSVRRWT